MKTIATRRNFIAGLFASASIPGVTEADCAQTEQLPPSPGISADLEAVIRKVQILADSARKTSTKISLKSFCDQCVSNLGDIRIAPPPSQMVIFDACIYIGGGLEKLPATSSTDGFDNDLFMPWRPRWCVVGIFERKSELSESVLSELSILYLEGKSVPSIFTAAVLSWPRHKPSKLFPR